MNPIDVQLRLARDGFRLDAAFSVPGAGVTAVFGPSGSGKTTLLRAIAGLDRATGSVRVGGEVWQDDKTFVPVHKRAVGYVFQEPSLFPHLSVRENLLYGQRRVAPSRQPVRFDDVVDWLGLAPLLDRRDPAQLSGGERQRVALGRALLMAPRLLLMDEPVSALDGAAKAQILTQLERLHRDLQIPVLYVSHALDEVARLADHLVLLEAGKVTAVGPLAQTLARLDLPLSSGHDAQSVLDATVLEHDDTYGQTHLACPGGMLWVTRLHHAPGTRLRTRVLAQDVALATTEPQQTSVSNCITAQIVAMQDQGQDAVLVQLLADGAPLLARITRRSRDRLGLVAGQQVYAWVKATAVMAEST